MQSTCKASPTKLAPSVPHTNAHERVAVHAMLCDGCLAYEVRHAGRY